MKRVWYLSDGSVSDTLPLVLSGESPYERRHALTVKLPLVVHVHHIDL